jgi:hypothetical protein
MNSNGNISFGAMVTPKLALAVTRLLVRLLLIPLGLTNNPGY